MNVGDMVKKDETILEISTDKVDSEVPSPATGEIISILFDANETVEVGTVIGVIGEKGEKINKEDNSEKSDSEKKNFWDQMNKKILQNGLTFDDVLLLPRYSSILPSKTNISLE